MLLSADSLGTTEIMRRTGTSKTCVWRWQERFMQEGVEGLLRDNTRPSRITPLDPDVAERVVTLTLSDPPAEATHWTTAMMAQQTGISASAPHLAGSWAPAASLSPVQALERSQVRREAQRCGRRSTGSCHRAVSG